MNWQKEAIEDLKNYKNLKEGIKSIKLRIRILDDNLRAIKSGDFSEQKVQGGNKKNIDDKMIENIAQRERLSLTLKANEILAERIEQGLQSLDDNERMVIVQLVINDKKNAIIELSRNLAYEKSKIYTLRNEALKKFTKFMYGITEF
mgnify:CR=1 FL=1